MKWGCRGEHEALPPAGSWESSSGGGEGVVFKVSVLQHPPMGPFLGGQVLVPGWGHRGDTHSVGCAPKLGRGFETCLGWVVVLPVRNEGELPLHAPQHPSSLQISLDPPKCPRPGGCRSPSPKARLLPGSGISPNCQRFSDLVCALPWLSAGR